MNPILRTLHSDHRDFAILLGILEEQAVRMESGQRPDLVVIEAIVSYLRRYGDLCHHPRENVLYRLLVERHIPGATRASRLAAQHRHLGETTSAALTTVREASMGDATRAAEVLGVVRALLVEYRDHTDAEDREFLPLVATSFEEKDWAAAQREFVKLHDAELAEHVSERFLALQNYIHTLHRLGARRGA